jgi:hypothetical protein
VISKYSWELLTKVYGLDPSRLYVTYFEGYPEGGLEPDTEAKELWLAAGVPEDHIVPGNLKVRLLRGHGVHDYTCPVVLPLSEYIDCLAAQIRGAEYNHGVLGCANNIAARTISGRWATPVLAVHAARSMWTESEAEMLHTSSVSESVRSLSEPR